MVKYYHDKTPKIQCFVKDTFMLQAAPEGESQNQNDTEVLCLSVSEMRHFKYVRKVQKVADGNAHC